MKYEKWPPWFSNIPDDKLWINLAWPIYSVCSETWAGGDVRDPGSILRSLESIAIDKVTDIAHRKQQAYVVS